MEKPPRRPRQRPRAPFPREHRASPLPPAGLAGRAQVEGRRAVLEALRAGAEVHRVRVSETAEPSKVLDEALREAKSRHVLVEHVPPEVLDALTATGHHQGMIAEVRLSEPVTLEALVARAREGGRAPFLVVLDGIEDPQNLGAIARSAEAAGANGLVLPERHSAGLSPGSLRASAGALLLMPVAIVSNIARALEYLKGQEVWIAGAHPDGGRPYHEASLTGPLALVIGAESRGLHRLVRERCDFLVSIPLAGRIESLNASAAAAVVLFEAARQRRAGAAPPEDRTKTPK